MFDNAEWRLKIMLKGYTKQKVTSLESSIKDLYKKQLLKVI